MYKFGIDDVFYNRIKAFPEVNFIIYDNQIFYQNKGTVAGQNVSNVPNVPTGHINLYELNVDRPSGQLVYPFVVKGGSLTSFSTISTSKFNSDFLYGDIITGSYPLSASISDMLPTHPLDVLLDATPSPIIPVTMLSIGANILSRELSFGIA